MRSVNNLPLLQTQEQQFPSVEVELPLLTLSKSFTFTSAAGSVYGYYLARKQHACNTHGVLDGGSVAAGTQITKTGCKGVIGADYLNLLDVDLTPTITAGVSGTFEITVDSGNNIAAGQRVSGTGIAAETRVVGIHVQLFTSDKALQVLLLVQQHSKLTLQKTLPLA